MGDHLEDTELTLGLPGGGDRRLRKRSATSPERVVSSGHKRGLVETADESDGVDFDSLSSNGKSSMEYHVVDDHHKLDLSEATSQAPPRKAQVIGWPPVRSYRKKVFEHCKYVKVAADGVPYLRKVDLETFNSYQHLLTALNHMFCCFHIRGIINESSEGEKDVKLQVKGTIEYVPTFEDKDGDLMLVGDVPWKMFRESCKRIWLMKSSEAFGLAPTRSQDE